MNVNYLKIFVLLSTVIIATSCGKDDDNAVVPEADTAQKTVITYDVPYSITVTSNRPQSKIAYAESDDGERINISFTDADVSKPLVMTISGNNVSGTLTLRNTSGLFEGALQVSGNVPDTLQLTGTIDIPAAGGEDDGCSTVSLTDLMGRCGHKYTVNFGYRSDDPIYLNDSKAYFHFKMSPYQKWMFVNDRRIALNADGKVWIAVDSKTAVITNFYRMPYEQVEGGYLYTISRSGFVDLGIIGVLWADKNADADNPWDNDDFFSWDNALVKVKEPLDLPKVDDSGNDFATLFDQTDCSWGSFNGISGMFCFMKGYTDRDKDPFIFLPASGISVGSKVYYANIYGEYWTSSSYDGTDAYYLNFSSDNLSADGHEKKNGLKMPIRTLWRIGVEGDDPNQGGGGSGSEQNDLLPIYFPPSYNVNDVVACYRGIDSKDEAWGVFLFDDGTYVMTTNMLMDGVLFGSVLITGSWEIAPGCPPDWENTTLNIFMDGLGMTYALPLTFVDGIGTLESMGLSNRFGYFELSEMKKMLGQ